MENKVHSELHGKSPSIHQSLLFVPQLSVTASLLTRLMTPGHTKPVGRLKQRCLTVRWKVNDSFDVTCHIVTLHIAPLDKSTFVKVNPIEVQWPELRWLETGNGTGLELMASALGDTLPNGLVARNQPSSNCQFLLGSWSLRIITVAFGKEFMSIYESHIFQNTILILRIKSLN